MTLRGPVTARTVPSRVLRHLERYTVATGTFPHAEVQLERQKAVCGDLEPALAPKSVAARQGSARRGGSELSDG